ncbi:hypothetical protein SH139x_003888 [Planctomycetaceae bacterium SH139]
MRTRHSPMATENRSSRVLTIHLCAILGLLPASLLTAQEPVRAELGEESVWMGQAVPLLVTLYSPGPFSGTAAFELPKIPRTIVMKAGTPLVGNEDIDGVSYFTQQHEFTIYTQQTGEVVIPAFRIRFSGKKTFTSEPESMEGSTPELLFESRRPPDTEQFSALVSAAELASTQSWNPEATEPIKAGDIVERTIARRVSGTAAMMMPPVTTAAPLDVRVYLDDPIIKDQIQRGEATAERIDTIKYQFEQAGTYQLPEMSFVWWDVQSSELKRTMVPGNTFTVEGPQAAAESTSGLSEFRWLLAILVVGFLSIGTVTKLLSAWRLRHNRPEEIAARRLLAACHMNAPADAYTALLQWQKLVCGAHRASGIKFFRSAGDASSLEAEQAVLARHLFGGESPQGAWAGQKLAATFTQARRRIRLTVRGHRAARSLPQLNP